jgi:two-component system chemotaxis response regulator CheB
MASPDVIVIGASAGGVEALRNLASALPPDLPAAVFVVMHLPEGARSMLPDILTRSGPLPARHAADGLAFSRGNIYVAPPDHHLVLEGARMRVVHGPRQNRHRPAVDPLFRSAALTLGPRVVGVVLTGALDDGAAGLASIRKHGGVGVVQDPADAFFPGMPQSAIAAAQPEHVVPLAQMAAVLSRVVREDTPLPDAASEDERLLRELRADEGKMEDIEAMGTRAGYGCPECSGALWEIDDGALLRFRCRVGHGYTAEGLLSEHQQSLENSLWAAIRALEESASVAHRMSERTLATPHASARLLRRAEVATSQAARLRQLITPQAAEE